MSLPTNFFIGRGAKGSSWFINHGPGEPSWDVNNRDFYVVSQIQGHYGMHTDPFGRYAILGTRGTGSGNYDIWIPILETGLDISNSVTIGYPDTPGNSFGLLADTINGYVWHQVYSTSELRRYQLPSAFGLADEDNPTGTFLTGNSTYQSYSGSANYGFNDNDTAYYDYIDNLVYIGGRTGRDIRGWNGYTGSTSFGTKTFDKTLGTTNSYGIYGAHRDFSSRYWVSAHRSNEISVSSPNDSSNNFPFIKTVTTGFSSTEDCFIAWTGDLYSIESSANSSSNSISRTPRI